MNILIHNILKYFTVFIGILMASYFLPKLYSDFFSKRAKNTLIYYSVVDNNFYKYEYIFGKKVSTKYSTIDNKELKKDDYVKLFPFSYGRYLLENNLFPKKFNYILEEPEILKRNSQYFRFDAAKINAKQVPLYMMLESKPKYKKLKKSDDLYRLTKNSIEFIDLTTNTVKKEKTQHFTKALKESGAVFPLRNAYSNPSTMKSFDEGTFFVDNNFNVFHVKMIEGKAFVKNTKIQNKDIKNITISESPRREFYGSLVTSNEVFLISYKNYELIKMPYLNYDYKNTDFKLTVNPVNKNLTFTKYNEDKNEVIIDTIVTTHDYKIKDKLTYIQSLKQSYNYEFIKELIFPFELRLDKTLKYYYSFKIENNFYNFIYLNLILFFVYLLFLKVKQRDVFEYKMNYLIILCSGIYGLLSIFLFSKFIKNYDKDKEEI